MLAIPPASARSTRLLGLLTPFAIMIGVVVLLLLPNLFMHAGADPVSGSSVPAQGDQAASQSAAAAMASPMVR